MKPQQPLTFERQIAASPETVFHYLTDPTVYVEWMGQRADLDPQPGGVYRVIFPEGMVAVGEYVTVHPHQRVMWTWGWEGHDGIPPGSTEVDVTLTPLVGGTLLTLVHRDLPTTAAQGEHTDGWTRYLDRLVTLLSA